MEVTNNNNNNDEIELDLKEIFFVLLGKLHIIVIAGILVGIAAFLFTKLCITEQFQSQTKLFVVSKASTADLSSLTSLADLQLGSQVLEDYTVMIKSRPVINKVIKNLELDETYESLCAKIATNNPENTRILEVTVTHPDPYMAKEIADEVAEVSAKQIAKIMEVKAPNIFEKGNLPTKKSSPNTSKNTIIGLILGAFIAVAIIIVRYMMDDTIQSQEDVEKYLGLNTLGVIPIEEGSTEQMKKDKRKRKKDMR